MILIITIAPNNNRRMSVACQFKLPTLNRPNLDFFPLLQNRFEEGNVHIFKRLQTWQFVKLDKQDAAMPKPPAISPSPYEKIPQVAKQNR